MSTITKERAVGIANGEKCYTHDDVVELARIALASLESEGDSESVAFINEAWTLVYYRPPKELGLKIGDKLYAAPLAPVFPDEMAISDDMNLFQKSFAQGHNACRYAMLHGKE
ncbi:Eaa protein [Enterobacter ludwigii]|uniref:Eaa protein n=1 Tax=Enterobacter ludwigii TaxID=299767 RepID=UPI0038769C71